MGASDAVRFELDDQLCFAAHDASRALTNAYREGLAAQGLTYTQYVVMLLLWEHGTLPMTELCRRLHLDSATLSPLLKRLEAQGLVGRRRSTEDERVVEVTATEAGHELRDPCHQVQREVQRRTGLSNSELATLRGQLQVLSQALRTEPGADAL